MKDHFQNLLSGVKENMTIRRRQKSRLLVRSRKKKGEEDSATTILHED